MKEGYTMLPLKKLLCTACIFSFVVAPAAHAENQIFTITAKDGHYVPDKIDVPAGQKIHLVVKNADKAEVEFESYPLNQEQKIQSGEQIDAYVGPLDAGKSYEFFDDNNPDAKGTLSAQ